MTEAPTSSPYCQTSEKKYSKHLDVRQQSNDRKTIG